MTSLSRFAEISAIVALLLTGIAPLLASAMKSAQVRRRFHFEPCDEVILMKGGIGNGELAPSDIERGNTASEADNPVQLSEKESKEIIALEQSLAATSVAELKGFEPESRGGRLVLTVFIVVLLLFGAVNVIFYWNQIRTMGNVVLWALGLLVAMVGGMFVQVLSANYRSGNPLFSVGAAELIFPLLFSPIVFYPVWALASNGTQNLFSYYAAFLNGYFWQAVVSAARVPARK
jgi:hypothetical protein